MKKLMLVPVVLLAGCSFFKPTVEEFIKTKDDRLSLVEYFSDDKYVLKYKITIKPMLTKEVPVLERCSINYIVESNKVINPENETRECVRFSMVKKEEPENKFSPMMKREFEGAKKVIKKLSDMKSAK